MAEADDLTLPSRGKTEKIEDRTYRTALPTNLFLALETEAMERGLKAYSLTKKIMTMYLHKRLVVVSELPEPLQQQILTHYRTKQSAAR